jgi:hypothetical protein
LPFGNLALYGPLLFGNGLFLAQHTPGLTLEVAFKAAILNDPECLELFFRQSLGDLMRYLARIREHTLKYTSLGVIPSSRKLASAAANAFSSTVRVGLS